jgi:glycosyltransferase involved in cell wall biosynthesis
MASVAVITATTGSPRLAEAVASVAAQTYRGGPIEHWIVVDGHEFEKGARQYAANATVVVLPRNTGGPAAGNYVCHRIYAAAPWLVDTTYVCFLDEDNAFAPDHIAGLVEAVETLKTTWAHSLRTIVDADGRPICVDACESLAGIRHSVLHTDDFLVDTNCYLLPTGLARQLSPCWNVPARPGPGMLEADRALCRTLLASTLLPGVSRRHSLRYRVGNRENSVQARFFLDGNRRTGFDASKPDVYLFHFTKDATATALSSPEPADPLAEWAPTMWHGLRKTHNLLDGYANASIIPAGATVLVSLCHPQALPLDLLKRTDLCRILAMIESPNIRHAVQYDRAFLDAHADVVMTYWADLLETLGPARGVWLPMNTHQMDLANPQHRRRCLRDNMDTGRSVGMVLERRNWLGGSYEINGVTLQALDPLRLVYAKALRDVVCYGATWKDTGVTTGHTFRKNEDPLHSVDYLERHTFALIVENCDAAGYVSEKFYDALMAGCIPLYFGSPVTAHALPPDIYIDIRQFESGESLQAHLDTLSDDDVAGMKRAVADKREAVLRGVGVQAYAARFLEARAAAARG